MDIFQILTMAVAETENDAKRKHFHWPIDFVSGSVVTVVCALKGKMVLNHRTFF